MELEVKKINLDDWVLSGGGGNGQSYNHKDDPTILLKMNKASLPKKFAEFEYLRTDSLYAMGVSCAKVIDLVTDGKRFGLIIEKVKDKRSFARIISDNPDQIVPLAKSFAQEARQLHQIRCNNGLIPSYRDEYLKYLSQCRFLSKREKRILKDALDAMDDKDYCVHGDLTPGNIIRADGKNFWIDLGDVTYGDPDIDFGNMMFVSNHVPPKLIEYLYHVSRDQFREFVDAYAHEYFGERWGSQALQEKLQKVLLVKVGLSVLKHPAAGIIYRPFIKGHKHRYALMRKLMDLFVRKY